MQSISVFLDIGEFSNFWWRSADVRRMQGVCDVNDAFFGSSLGKAKLCQFSTL